MYISQDPIRLDGRNPTFYSYVCDTNSYLDPLGLDSTALDKALGGVKGDGLQAHHIIPEEVWKNNQYMFDTLGMEMDVARNGIHLADSDAGRVARGDAVYHRGSHPDYNAKMEVEVEKIAKEWKLGRNDADIKNRLEALQNKTRTDIQNGNVPKSKTPGKLCKIG